MEVHRCRFGDYVPSAINSLAFAPPSAAHNVGSIKPGGIKYPYLAVGRANGDIEIWNTRAGFTLEKTIPGQGNNTTGNKNNSSSNKSQSLEVVVWTHQTKLTKDDLEIFDEPEEQESAINRLRQAPPRLFSAGLNAAIVEWDLATLNPKHVVDSYGGSVWCMAANNFQTMLAVGTEDGRVRLFDIADDTLEYVRSFDPIKSRILCISWIPGDEVIVTGSADGTIRKWDVESGHCISRMTVERDGNEPSLIWSILTLPDGTIVSGDSRGQVTFWDNKQDVVSQKFRSHEADILCLAADESGRIVYSSGVDPKITVYHRKNSDGPRHSDANKLHANRSGSRRSPKWIVAGFRRYHTHDVRALAVDTTRPVDVLVSGGVDTQLATCPATPFPEKPQRRMPCFPPMHSVVSIASDARLFMQRQNSSIKVWQLGSAQPASGDTMALLETGHDMPVLKLPKNVLRLDLKTSSALISSAISKNGSWIAASDNVLVRLFKVTKDDTHEDLFTVKKMAAFPPKNLVPKHLKFQNATRLAFTPDSKKLIVCTSESLIVVVDITKYEDDEFPVLKRFAHHRETEEEWDEDKENAEDSLTIIGSHPSNDSGIVILKQVRTINNIAISSDGRYLLTTDSLSYGHVFDLEKLEYHASLPQFGNTSTNPYTAIGFRCGQYSHQIVACTSDRNIFVWDAETKSLIDWSKKYSHDTFPKNFKNIGDKVSSIITNPAEPECIYLHAPMFICRVDLSKPPGDPRTLLNVTKRKRIEQGIFNQVSALRKAAKARAQLKLSKQSHKTTTSNGGGDDDDDDDDDDDGKNNKGGDQQSFMDVSEDGMDDDQEWEEMVVNRLNEAGIVADEIPNFGMLTRYQPIMASNFLKDNEMVVIERSWADLAVSLPPAFYRHKYGT